MRMFHCALRTLMFIALVVAVSGFVVERQRHHGSPSISCRPKHALKGSSNEEEPEFDSLDVMLAKARKRGVNPMIRIQAFADAPVISNPITLTRGDVLFTTVALLIGAKGFALGLLLGKWTSTKLPFRQALPPILVQLYPVLLAIACDLLI